MTDATDPPSGPPEWQPPAGPDPTPVPAAEPQAPPAAVSPPRTDGSAVASLVIAILSWFVLPVVGSVIALVLARRAERSIQAAPFAVTGRGLVTAARWVAWTHLVVVAMVVAFVAAFVIAVWIGR